MKNERINIGNFNEKITWMAPTSSRSVSGQPIRSFTEYKTDYADIQPATISEAELSGRIQYSETYTFTTHFDSAINSRYQITYNTDNYNIIKIEKLNLNRFIRVTANKIVS